MSVEFLLTSLVAAAIPTSWRSCLGYPGFGLSGIMQAGALAFEVIRWAGVAYLVYMGISMIRDGGSLTLDGEDESADSIGLIVWRGILLNLLNPKLIVFSCSTSMLHPECSKRS